jgi:hypothetical protein
MLTRAGCVCADRGIYPPARVACDEQEPARAIRRASGVLAYTA